MIGSDSQEDAHEDLQISAGGVVYRHDGLHLEICVISKKGGRVWALPKGRVNQGEKPEETARREVLEETGHLTEVRHRIDEIAYKFYWKDNNTFYRKTVTFFLMALVQEDAQGRDQEADEVRWIPLDEAPRRLSYFNEREVVRKARRLLRHQRS